MNQIIDEILKFKNFDIYSFYELLSKYNKNDCYAAFNLIKKKKNKELNKIFLDAYIMIELENMTIDDKSYLILASKYGESDLEQFLIKLLQIKKYNIDKKFEPLFLYIDNPDNYFYNSEDAQSIFSSDSVNQYLHEIGHFPLLTKDEEKSLFTKLTECKNIITIARSTNDGGYEISNIYNILFSITNGNQCKILKKLCNYLTNNDKTTVSKYLELWKKINSNNSDMNALPDMSIFSIDNVTETYDKDFLTSQLENILLFFQIREKIINSNLRLAVTNSKKYIKQASCSLEFLDFIQAANIGIIKAVIKYDVNKGFKFSTYATWWIKQAINRHIADYGNTIRMPVHSHEFLRKIKRAISALTVANGEEPDNYLIANYLKTDVETINSFRAMTEPLNLLSIDEPISEERDADVVSSYIIAPDSSVDDIYEKEELSQLIIYYLDRLTERERTVLTFRYGLNGNKELTLAQTGNYLGITRERVRQIEAKALRKLKMRMTRSSLNNYSK